MSGQLYILLVVFKIHQRKAVLPTVLVNIFPSSMIFLICLTFLQKTRYEFSEYFAQGSSILIMQDVFSNSCIPQNSSINSDGVSVFHYLFIYFLISTQIKFYQFFSSFQYGWRCNEFLTCCLLFLITDSIQPNSLKLHYLQLMLN